MLRPGRLDKLLYVELPTASERYEILNTLAVQTPLADDVDLRRIAEDARCDNFRFALKHTVIVSKSLLFVHF